MSGTINSQGWLLGTDGDDVLSLSGSVLHPVIDGFAGYDTLLASLSSDLLAPVYGNSNAPWTTVRNVESLELTLYDLDGAGGYDSFNFTENMSFFNSDIQHLRIATPMPSVSAEQSAYVPPFTFTVTGGSLAQFAADFSGAIELNGYQDHLVLDFTQVSPSWLFQERVAGGELTLTEGSRTLTFTGYEVLDIFYGDDNDELWTTWDYPYDNSRIGVIDTGAGDDSVDYSSTGGTILTGEGNDWVSLDNLVFGATVDLGEGDDEVRSVGQQCRIFGRGGNDSIEGNGTDWINGGAGNDHLVNGKMMQGGAGNDVFEFLGDFAASVYGGAGNDRVLNSWGDYTRTLDGGSGDDYIQAAIGGDSSISGGAGRDAIDVHINGQAGLDSRVDGGAGDDLIGIDYTLSKGALVTDVLGGAGNDLILFSNWPGDSTFALLPGAEVDGGAGKDLIGGSVGGDTLKGGAGDDYISDDGFGAAWNQEATYNTSDMLAVLSTIAKGAGGGNDVLIGGLGNDTLSGGLGMDKLIGGAGQDRFLFETAPALYNTDRVVDFVSGEDKLLLDATIYTALGLSGTSAGEALPEALFRTGYKAITAEQRLIFNVNTHLLSYDADGNGSGEAVPIAIIAGQSLSLHASDFLIV